MSSGRESGILSNGAVRERVFKNWGYKCCNCGTTEDLRLDHIVGIKVGGNDIESNLCVLCVQCHYKKHILDKTSEAMSERIKAGKARSVKPDGMPRAVPENYKELLNDYVFCRIGKKELGDRWGITATSRKEPGKKKPVDMVHLVDRVWYKEYLRELGIAKVHNGIDAHVSKKHPNNHTIKDGTVIGTITYIDGKVEKIVYKSLEPTER